MLLFEATRRLYNLSSSKYLFQSSANPGGFLVIRNNSTLCESRWLPHCEYKLKVISHSRKRDDKPVEKTYYTITKSADIRANKTVQVWRSPTPQR